MKCEEKNLNSLLQFAADAHQEIEKPPCVRRNALFVLTKTAVNIGLIGSILGFAILSSMLPLESQNAMEMHLVSKKGKISPFFAEAFEYC